MKRRWLPSLLCFLGLLLLGSFVFEIALRLVGETRFTWPFIAGVSTSLPFALVPIGGGYSLIRNPVPEEYYQHLAIGTLSGLAFFTVFFGVVGFTLFDAWIPQAGVLRWGVTVGVGNGFLISYLYVRGVSQAVALERTSVHAEEAEDQQRLLRYLNGLLRHEVLNAANAIKGHASLAAEATQNEDVHDRIAVIQRQTDGMTSIIDDVQVLLAVSEDRDELGPVNLTPLLREELRRVEERHCPVVTELQVPGEVYVRGDTLLRRLFSNLFDNAVEHNDSEHPKITVRATRSGETVAVAVEDNGPGFPTDSLGDVFEPLEQMDTTHGMGLAIVTQLAKRYGGSLELIETGDTGSVVTVTLPRASGDTPDSDVSRS
ncbi:MULTISPECIES: sensor histidine kinase [Salinibaculum]|uniref:sensor histidine kinase n=1 Tax=Salinibaculum TaxID=2732368 RepID=UPI0030D218CD